MTCDASKPSCTVNITKMQVAGTTCARRGHRGRVGYFKTTRRETLNIPTRNMDNWAIKFHNTTQIVQKKAFKNSGPSLFDENAASITGTVAAHIQKSLNVMIM